MSAFQLSAFQFFSRGCLDLTAFYLQNELANSRRSSSLHS